MWDEEMRRSLVDAMKDPFSIQDNESRRTKSARCREMSRESLVKRITPQIKEMEEYGLPWSTPEEWDQSFQILGGGSTRRTSDAILVRMTWKEFLSLTRDLHDD